MDFARLTLREFDLVPAERKPLLVARVSCDVRIVMLSFGPRPRGYSGWPSQYDDREVPAFCH